MTSRIQSRPRTKPAEERRDDLMNAAQELFLRQGVASTTIEQITTAAEVAKGTFYLHFTSKEDVLAALRQRFIEDFVERLKTATAKRPKKDWKGKLSTWAQASITGYLDAVPLHDVVFHEFHPHAREQHNDNLVADHLAALLADGAADGAWSVDHPRLTAVFLFAGIHGIVDDALLAPPPIDRKRLIRKAQEICFKAVGLAAD